MKKRKLHRLSYSLYNARETEKNEDFDQFLGQTMFGVTMFCNGYRREEQLVDLKDGETIDGILDWKKGSD